MGQTMAMLITTRATKLMFVLAAIAGLTFASTAPSQAQTGSVRLNILKAGFIVGAGGGSGTLSYHGKTYRLSIGGLILGTLRAGSTELVGTTSNLHRPSETAGTYGAAGVGVTLV